MRTDYYAAEQLVSIYQNYAPIWYYSWITKKEELYTHSSTPLWRNEANSEAGMCYKRHL